jgi:hypothetical protein
VRVEAREGRRTERELGARLGSFGESLETEVSVVAVEPTHLMREREGAGEPETVQTLSGWGARFPERSWSLNRRGVENTRGRQPTGSTWRWPVLGESL